MHQCIVAALLLIEFMIILLCLELAGNVNFLIADGLKFSHPLHHLGKGPEVLSNK